MTGWEIEQKDSADVDDHIESRQLVMNYYTMSFIKTYNPNVDDVVHFNRKDRRLH